MIDPHVRPAAAIDAPDVSGLEAEARTAVAGQRGGLRWLEVHPEVGQAWPARIAAGGVLVGTIDDVVVGYLAFEIADQIATVSQVWVTPEARQVGLGDALLAGAVAQARRSGCSVIEGVALPGDRETKNLYERAGITARLIVVSKRLDQLPIADD